MIRVALLLPEDRIDDHEPEPGPLTRFRFTDYAYMEKQRTEWERTWTRIKVGG